MVGKAALNFQNHFKNWSKFIGVFSFKNTLGSFDETMFFTVVVSALKRSSLIFLVVELTIEVVTLPCRESNSMLVKEHAKI